MKHIIFGESAAGSLKVALTMEKPEIIVFPELLGEGPIHALVTDDGLNKRVNWLEQALRIDGTEWHNRFTKAMQQLEAFTKEDAVLVWASENATEQFGLRLVCYLLQEKNSSIYFCPTYENMLHMHRAKNVQMEIRHSGEVNAQQMLTMLQTQQYRKLTAEEIQLYSEQAKQLMQGNSLLRTWHQGEILQNEETRDDAFILRTLNELLQESDEEYLKAARLIGQVLGLSAHAITDSWIEYRLLTLIQQGVVHYRGDLRQMRTYEVKRGESDIGALPY